ncbi:MAG: hypothetical protein KKD32_03660 [Proteobacteria bacterium]|nr:hypothetical protein [Pseudomonadota bacterium]MBU1586257.1 hypothetical protein [Pseudomonadota bacterium]MBU2453153.1 hypothetical protein [Pseudomonadota bacterium]MBU2630816.1 hypothetical protein [Pseudomonadota bacterium]
MKPRTPEQEMFDENPDYTHFVVDTSLCEIESGWYYKEDAQEHLNAMKQEFEQAKYYKVWTRNYTKRFFEIY